MLKTIRQHRVSRFTLNLTDISSWFLIWTLNLVVDMPAFAFTLLSIFKNHLSLTISGNPPSCSVICSDQFSFCRHIISGGDMSKMATNASMLRLNYSTLVTNSTSIDFLLHVYNHMFNVQYVQWENVFIHRWKWFWIVVLNTVTMYFCFPYNFVSYWLCVRICFYLYVCVVLF